MHAAASSPSPRSRSSNASRPCKAPHRELTRRRPPQAGGGFLLTTGRLGHLHVCPRNRVLTGDNPRLPDNATEPPHAAPAETPGPKHTRAPPLAPPPAPHPP